MYEKHIKTLEMLIGTFGHARGLYEESVRTAIELMRAAEPSVSQTTCQCQGQDRTCPCTERGHCAAAVRQAMPNLLGGWETMERLLMRERAVVRAECAAEIERLRRERQEQYELGAKRYRAACEWGQRWQEAETKLTALLEAAVAYMSNLADVRNRDRLRAAIEAAKK